MIQPTEGPTDDFRVGPFYIDENIKLVFPRIEQHIQALESRVVSFGIPPGVYSLSVRVRPELWWPRTDPNYNSAVIYVYRKDSMGVLDQTSLQLVVNIEQVGKERVEVWIACGYFPPEILEWLKTELVPAIVRDYGVEIPGFGHTGPSDERSTQEPPQAVPAGDDVVWSDEETGVPARRKKVWELQNKGWSQSQIMKELHRLYAEEGYGDTYNCSLSTVQNDWRLNPLYKSPVDRKADNNKK
jgi:hypothetical protein